MKSKFWIIGIIASLIIEYYYLRLLTKEILMLFKEPGIADWIRGFLICLQIAPLYTLAALFIIFILAFIFAYISEKIWFALIGLKREITSLKKRKSYYPRKHKSKTQLIKRIIGFLLIIIFIGGLYHYRAFVIPTFLKFIGYEAPEIGPTVTPGPIITPVQTPSVTPTSTPTITSQPNITDIEAAIFIYTNIERRNHGVKELIWDEKLSEIAKAHSRDMVQNNFFSHINLRGEDPTARAKRYGYPLYKELGDGWYREGIAENIGKMPTGNVLGVGYVSNDADSIAKAQVESWMSSSGHRRNILDPSYDRLGAGVAYDGLYYISTQNFW